MRLKLFKWKMFVFWTSIMMLQTQSVSAQNPIVEENLKPGARDWQLTRVRLNDAHGFRSPWIEFSGWGTMAAKAPG